MYKIYTYSKIETVSLYTGTLYTIYNNNCNILKWIENYGDYDKTLKFFSLSFQKPFI